MALVELPVGSSESPPPPPPSELMVGVVFPLLLLLIKLALRFEWGTAAAPLSSASPARMEAASAMDGSDGVLASAWSLSLRRFGMVDGLNSGEQ
jgi:hypothetical protein